jgi:hypothetical protein
MPSADKPPSRESVIKAVGQLESPAWRQAVRLRLGLPNAGTGANLLDVYRRYFEGVMSFEEFKAAMLRQQATVIAVARRFDDEGP